MRDQDQDQDHDDDNINEKEQDLHEHDMVMPGFRFHPTEEELIEFYLRRKIEGKRFNVDLITFLDLYRYDPWELPALAAIGEKEWYFYVPRDRKYRNGDRPNRVTTSGYWKATGADRLIKNENLKPIGLKKTLVFYSGKAPRGIRTSWIMNEYRLPHHETEMLQKAEISLCRVYKRPGVEEHRHLGKAASSSSSKGVVPRNLNTKPTSQQQDVVMNSSRGQIDEADKMMSAETSASSSTADKHDNNNSSYDNNIINHPFLHQIPSILPPTHTSSFFSIFGGCSNINNNMNPPVILPHDHQNQNNIQFEDLQTMPASYQQSYLNQQQQQPLLGLNMVPLPNSSFWDQWTSSSNNSVLHGDQGNNIKSYINATNPFG